MSGTLYLIPNTLGVLDGGRSAPAPLAAAIPQQVRDITTRLDYFIVENAKTARAYLKSVGTITPIQDIEMRVLDKNTASESLSTLLAPILAGRDAGLISEAGCPAVADPGADLVRLAHARGVCVRPLVGPSSILLTVMASGLSGQSFAFVGYLPSDPAGRALRLKELEERSHREQQTQVFIETPYRNTALIEAISSVLQPQTEVCIAVDLTLPTENVETLPAHAWRARAGEFQKRPAVFALLKRAAVKTR